MSQMKRVLEHLQKYGKITNREMSDKFYINCPYDVIRDLRKKYGAESITDEWITKKRKEYKANGEIELVTIRYKQYFWNKLSDCVG